MELYEDLEWVVSNVDFNSGWKLGLLGRTNVKVVIRNTTDIATPFSILRYTINNRCYRVDGPAIDLANGDKRWHKNGKLHRDNDLPAIEFAAGYHAWFKNGVQIK